MGKWKKTLHDCRQNTQVYRVADRKNGEHFRLRSQTSEKKTSWVSDILPGLIRDLPLKVAVL